MYCGKCIVANVLWQMYCGKCIVAKRTKHSAAQQSLSVLYLPMPLLVLADAAKLFVTLFVCPLPAYATAGLC